MKLNLLVLSFFILLWSTSCSKYGFQSSRKKKSIENVDRMLTRVNEAWTAMIQSDNQKIADINRLLLEISYTENHDEAGLRVLKDRTGELLSQRYEQYEMTSEAIDEYDNATTALIRSVLEFAENTPELEKNSLSGELKGDIIKADSEVVLYRIRYDSEAREFNSYLNENAGILKRLGEPYASFKPLPLFELPQ